MKARMAVIGVALGLTLFAGALRFWRLGAWPFFGDEIATLQEADFLWGESRADLATQSQRLPKLVPLAYTLHFFGYEVFGRDELGSRVVPALLGTLIVPLVFLLLRGPLGQPAALATALLIAVWPDHVNRSQDNRFYAIAAFFAFLCLLLGAHALRRRSTVLAVLAGIIAFAAVLSHTLEGILMAGLVGTLLLPQWMGERQLRWRLPVTAGVFCLLLAVFAACYVLPLARGWNRGETWGVSPILGLVTSVAQVGWPVLLLACLGALDVWREPSEQGVYWLTWTALWGVAASVLPFLVVFHAGYVFPMALGVFVLAGCAVGGIYDVLRPRGAVLGWGWVACACGFALPSLASHFSDGSRWDYRTAARHIAKSWREGDQVAAIRSGTLDVYLSVPVTTTWLPPGDPVPSLESLKACCDRVWIVVPSGRNGVDESLRRWLGQNCFEQFEVRRPRFDHVQHVVGVFLYDATRNRDPRLVRDDGDAPGP
jgi:4-amino-4-deoxy-L-arabinose transferase-like glycosyltransferase